MLLPISQKLLSISKTKNDSPNVERSSTDRVSLIRESLHHCNLSENFEELILQSWRASKKAKYKPVLEKWYKLFTEELINPFQPPLTFALNFLMSVKTNGGNFETMSNAGSALSSIISIDSMYTFWSKSICM